MKIKSVLDDNLNTYNMPKPIKPFIKCKLSLW